MAGRQDARGQRSETQPSVVAAALGVPAHVLRGISEFDRSGRYILRRLFSELFGTFLLVLAAAGSGVVNAHFGGDAVPQAAQVVVQVSW